LEPADVSCDETWDEVAAGLGNILVPLASGYGYSTLAVEDGSGEHVAGPRRSDVAGGWEEAHEVATIPGVGPWVLRVAGPPGTVPPDDVLRAGVGDAVSAMLRVWRSGVAARELMAEALHDMRAPLSVLRMAAEGRLAADGGDRVALETVAHLETLVEGMVTVYHTGQRPALTLERIDGAHLLRQVAAMLEPFTGDRVSYEVSGAAVVISDPTLVRRMVENVAVNAARATEVGVIELSVVPIADGVRFSVSDPGPGLPAEVLAVVSEPVEGLVPGAVVRRRRGVGVGWLVVRNLADRLFAHATVESGGGGTTVHFDVPSLQSRSGRLGGRGK